MNEEIIVLTEENYDAEVLQTPAPIVIDFYADWCNPCKLMAPAFDEAAAEYAGRVRFAKINVDESKKLAIKSKVLSIPTLLFFKDGEQVDRVTGPLDAVQLKGRLEALLP
ncbi:MAG: thioredoxin [Clostridiales Family XIII bacterium]|jgi:thioredoxin 1|nr:thioredoxin [Clostridiales Family XIII bacterium]